METKALQDIYIQNTYGSFHPTKITGSLYTFSLYAAFIIFLKSIP